MNVLGERKQELNSRISGFALTMAIVFLYNVHLLNFVHILCTVHAHKTARDASNKISPATIFLGPTNINLVVRRWELSRHGRKHQV